MKHFLLTVALIVSCSATQASAVVPITNPRPKQMVPVGETFYAVEGLQEITHEKLIGPLKRRVYHYKLSATDKEYVSYDKVKLVKDLRPFEVAHPFLSFGQKWGGTIITCGAYAASRVGLKK